MKGDEKAVKSDRLQVWLFPSPTIRRGYMEKGMSRRTLVLLGSLALMALALDACGGSTNAMNVDVNASEFRFDPAAISAGPGQAINLTVKNVGFTQHTWVLKESNVKLTIDPGKTATRTFTAPSKAGTYTFDCDIAGHKEAGMVGQLVVR